MLPFARDFDVERDLVAMPIRSWVSHESRSCARLCQTDFESVQKVVAVKVDVRVTHPRHTVGLGQRGDLLETGVPLDTTGPGKQVIDIGCQQAANFLSCLQKTITMIDLEGL